MREGACKGVVLVDIAPRMERSAVDRIVSWMTHTAQMGFDSLEEAAEAIALYTPQRRRDTNLETLSKNLRKSEGRWHWHWDPRFLDAANQGGVGNLEELAAEYTLGAAQMKVKCVTINR